MVLLRFEWHNPVPRKLKLSPGRTRHDVATISQRMMYIERRKPQIKLQSNRENMNRNFCYGNVDMVSTFPPRKHSAKMHLQNSPACAFGRNSPLPPNDSDWFRTGLKIMRTQV